MDKYFLGIDIGSSYSKGCLIDSEVNILADFVMDTGISFEKAAKVIQRRICDEAGIRDGDIASIVSTGIGREAVSFKDSSKTEISCLAKGSFSFFPMETTVIDIGGQDIKIVRINADGRETDFRISRKCAAGTGSFLEEISMKLRIPLERMNELAEKAERSVEVNSFCTVFAGTEIIHLLRQGKDIHGIARGVYESIVDRVLSMISIGGRYVLTGGLVAHNPVILKIFKEKTGKDPLVPPNPQAIVAYGAALFAAQGKDMGFLRKGGVRHGGSFEE